MSEKEVAEIPTQEIIQDAYNKYMHKCAEVGQLDIALKRLATQFDKDKQDLEVKKHNTIVDSDELAKKFNSLVQAKELADQQAKAKLEAVQ